MAKKVHADLLHLRQSLGPDATLSDAVKHALSKTEGTISLNLEKTGPAHAYFKDKDSRTLPAEIKESTLNLAGLVDLATTLSGRTAENLLAEGLVLACTRAVRDRFRAQAGETNARGASDGKIETAVKELQALNEIVTAKKIHNRCGVYWGAITRWLEQHPEVLKSITNAPAKE